MNEIAYSHGFLATTAALLIEHLLFYRRLRPIPTDDDDAQDRKVLAKFFLGVLAILLGCLVIRLENPFADPLLAPLASSTSGLVLVAAYAVRAAIRTAERRGWLRGLVDQADIAGDTEDGTTREPADRAH
jgi:hypothetical protein